MNSSLTNIISNTLWIKRNKLKSDFFIIMNFQKYNQSELKYIKKIYLKNLTSSSFYLVDLATNYQKMTRFIILYLFILLATIIKFFKINNFPELIIVQPRFRWLAERFRFLGKILPPYKTILVGDGLSSECLLDTPPWLKSTIVNYSRLGAERLKKSFYLYSIYNNLNKNKVSERFTKRELINTLFDVNEILLNESQFRKVYEGLEKIKIKYKKIFIFTTSTFSEYDRLSLDSEIELYISFLNNFLFNNNFNSSTDLLIFKYHPSTNNLKINKLKERVNSSFNIKYKTDIKFEKIIAKFPLELFLFNLQEKRDVVINGISTGIIASSYIFNNLKIELGFGEKLVKRFFKSKQFMDNRLKQEELISKLIQDKPN